LVHSCYCCRNPLTGPIINSFNWIDGPILIVVVLCNVVILEYCPSCLVMVLCSGEDGPPDGVVLVASAAKRERVVSSGMLVWDGASGELAKVRLYHTRLFFYDLDTELFYGTFVVSQFVQTEKVGISSDGAQEFRPNVVCVIQMLPAIGKFQPVALKRTLVPYLKTGSTSVNTNLTCEQTRIMCRLLHPDLSGLTTSFDVDKGSGKTPNATSSNQSPVKKKLKLNDEKESLNKTTEAVKAKTVELTVDDDNLPFDFNGLEVLTVEPTAAQAGLAPGMIVYSINGTAFDPACHDANEFVYDMSEEFPLKFVFKS